MWDQRYSGDEYAYGIEPNQFLESVANRIPKGKVLCVAEGEGRNAVYLASQGYDVAAVDFSSVGLEKSHRLASHFGVKISTHLSDLADYKFEGQSWEAIVSIFCHLQPDLRKLVHSRIVRALSPGGVLVLEAYTPQQLTYGTGGPPAVELLVTLEELRVDFSGLEFVIGREVERQVVEGSYHLGPSAVVQILARKPPVATRA
ncbi:MAG: class I SAM-dependent methyltransferase [Rhodothermales bacterium]|nr:class I SAM-dependent methyltransferase [Rhodothermales bacterium]